MKVWTRRLDADDQITEATVSDMQSLRGLRLTGTQPLASAWPRPLVFNVRTAAPPADVLVSGPMVVVSSRVADVLRKEVPPEDFELLAARLKQGERTVDGYSVLHVLRRLDALDRERAQYTVDGPDIDRIEHLVLDQAVAARAPMFELDAFEWVLCVHDTIADRMERMKATGVRFVDPGEWTPF